MPKRTVSEITLTLLLIGMLTLAFNAQPVKAGTVTVPDDYPTIQEAIDNANEGDTIFVRNGTYYERIVVNKRVSLVGEEKWTTIIDGSNNTTPITILASGVNISGFTIRNSSKLNPWFNPGTDGLYMEADNCTISHNIFFNNARGIRIYKSMNNTFYKNIITGNWADGFVVAGYCGDNTLDSNNVSNNGLGIVLYFTRYGGVLRNNKMMNNSYNFVVRPENPGRLDVDSSNTVNGKPIYYWVGEHDREVPEDAGYVAIINSKNILVENLTVADSGQGVLLYNSRNCSVREVNVINSLNGIMLWYSENCTIQNNTIMGCTVFLETLSGNGIFLLYSHNNTFYDNNIADNKFHGISMGSCQNNMFYHNNIINNRYQAKIYKLWWESFINTWDCGYPSGGNYWSDYNGTDLYVGPCQNETGSDGLGDTPCVIDEDNKDRYPLMNPWGTGTPVASFIWTPSIPKTSESVAFDASSSTPNGGTITKYEWNFGDGEKASGQIVTHAYTNPSIYTVTLSVTDTEGLWNTEQRQIQVVQPHGPEAEFTATPDTASTGDSIKFDASASLSGWNGTHEMPITEYRWDFGGGIKITTSTPIFYYSFISPGIYYVTITVYAPGATPETDTTSRKVTIISVPIGGFSLPIKRYTTAKPLMPYIILAAILTSISTTIKRETHKRTKRS